MLPEFSLLQKTCPPVEGVEDGGLCHIKKDIFSLPASNIPILQKKGKKEGKEGGRKKEKVLPVTTWDLTSTLTKDKEAP